MIRCKEMNTFLDRLDKYKITKEGIEIDTKNICIFLERQNERNYIPHYGFYNRKYPRD